MQRDSAVTCESGGLEEMIERHHTLVMLTVKIRIHDVCFIVTPEMFPVLLSCFFMFLVFNIALSPCLPVEHLLVSMLSCMFVSAHDTAVHDRGNEFLSKAATGNSLRINY